MRDGGDGAFIPRNTVFSSRTLSSPRAAARFLAFFFFLRLREAVIVLESDPGNGFEFAPGFFGSRYFQSVITLIPRSCSLLVASCQSTCVVRLAEWWQIMLVLVKVFI